MFAQAGLQFETNLRKIVCLPAYNLYTAEPVAMQARGKSMISEGPRPTRKRLFDTQPSSDKENQEDEMPELADTDSECDEEDEQRRAPDPVASTENDIAADDDDDAEFSICKKRKAPNKKRVFVPQKTWDLDEHDSADVYAAFCVELGEINTQAGLSKVKTLQHQDRNNIYGDWIFALHWISGSGSISNKVFMCPLVAFGAGPRSCSRIPMMLHGLRYTAWTSIQVFTYALLQIIYIA